MIPAGKRRHLLTIQTAVLTNTEDGAATETWRTFARTFGFIKPVGGAERFIAGGQQATSTHTITIPYLAGITPSMRATYNGRTFSFQSVNNVDEINREIVIAATEVLT